MKELTVGWDPLPQPIPPAPIPKGPDPQDIKGVNFISKKIPQSIIVMGGMAIPKTHPDFYAFSILNDIVGGAGFNSYLTEEIRSNRGLAYSVGSFYTGYPTYGVFGAYCFTSSSNTSLAISLIYKILD